MGMGIGQSCSSNELISGEGNETLFLELMIKSSFMMTPRAKKLAKMTGIG